MTTQLLRLELMRRLTAANPSLHHERVTALAEEIEATKAYAHDGTRIIPVGTRAALARAALIAPTIAAALTAEHVAALSATSSPESAPLDRARARLASMGINMDSALDGSAEDGREFYGLDLGNMPKGAA